MSLKSTNTTITFADRATIIVANCCALHTLPDVFYKPRT